MPVEVGKGPWFCAGSNSEGKVPFLSWGLEKRRRGKSEITVGGSPDKQWAPPQWMTDKNVAIDGSTIQAKDRGPEYFQNRYAKELVIAEAERRRRITGDTERVLGVSGLRSMLSALGLVSPHLSKEETQNSTNETAEEPRYFSRVEKKALTWNALVEAIEGDRSLVQVAGQFRNTFDCYGIDRFLDSAVSVIWSCTLAGVCVGMTNGTIRVARAIQVDRAFMMASGVSTLSLFLTVVTGSSIKWGCNFLGCSSAFVVGDRMATFAKSFVLPAHDARLRTPVNYSAGLACSFGALGILPWWVLGQGALGLKFFGTGVVVGGLLGIVVGRSLHQLAALNVARLNCSARELRRYEALLQRETKRYSSELKWIE